ncbi:WYL domain-containing protein [Alkalicoccobacillus gibsonii]|uniref:WYL domain-containing protein n=1 Tax=Alkalicoccobacillus gibsonii TaxID=79881 RepID=A0ABU9VIT6_9BACI|nr:hypothetical protein [Alkalicoccobacillus gibsonii]MBM0064064.1 hypothetical protein [Alkalicoccobacillus gibsonii]
MYTSQLTKMCLTKTRIALIYHSKSNEISHRVITPESISNGILSGYCHQKKQMRRFSLDRILSYAPVTQRYSKSG